MKNPKYNKNLEFDSSGRKFLKWAKMVPVEVWGILICVVVPLLVFGIIVFLL